MIVHEYLIISPKALKQISLRWLNARFSDFNTPLDRFRQKL